jgi:prepilin-type N-terminal cleavage/methylation domain-containing protein
MRIRRYAAAAGRRLTSERGYTLSELMVVLVILGVVLAALTQLFVSASTAQVDMTRRFEAQQQMRLALDKLRREIHCANKVVAAPPTSSIVISLGAYCPTNGTGAPVEVTWCTKDKNGTVPPNPNPAVGAPYSLWRHIGNACTGAGRKEADYLKNHDVFQPTGTPTPPGNLPTLRVKLPVDVKPGDEKQRYTLEDDIVLRNAGR